MKKIHILESQILNESQYFEAGTDHPYFEDERTGQSYEAYWNTEYGFPFGYWPEVYNGNDVFSIGDVYTTHENACGKMAKRYFYNVKKETIEEGITYFIDALEDLISDFKTYGYTYDDESGLYVSSDGSDEIDLDDWIYENCYSLDSEKAKKITENAINGGSIPYADELAEEIASNEAEYYDFTDRKGIDQALEEIGSDFDSYFESGRNEGRIWPHLGMIGFYATEQPDPQTLTDIMRDLANTGIVTYEDLLQYDMVFEDWRNDGQITACTLSDYIDGNYGPDSYEDEEDNDEYDDEEENEIQYARDGKTQFVPHLANQAQKREFFRDFRNTRDQAVYAPRERAAGNLARYHAMRYPYGENKNIIGKIIKEELNKILKGES
jgi:hypothetical protein